MVAIERIHNDYYLNYYYRTVLRNSSIKESIYLINGTEKKNSARKYNIFLRLFFFLNFVKFNEK